MRRGEDLVIASSRSLLIHRRGRFFSDACTIDDPIGNEKRLVRSGEIRGVQWRPVAAAPERWDDEAGRSRPCEVSWKAEGFGGWGGDDGVVLGDLGF